MSGLRERLMDPDLYKSFAAAFTDAWNELQGNTAAEQTARAAELGRIRHQLDHLVDAIANGTPPAAVNGRIVELERRRETLEAEAAVATAPAPRLHPNLAEAYRQKVAELSEALSRDDCADARELLRGLIDHITIYPDGTGQRIEIRGELSAILGLAQHGRNAKSARDTGALIEQMKLVAGAGFEPAAFRL